MTTTTTMPDGLPACFEDPDVGFSRLCATLEIANRAQQQAVLDTTAVKQATRSRKVEANRMPTAKRRRLLLLAFYESARNRRTQWHHTGRRQARIPSLEYHALLGYDSEFLDRKPEEEPIREALNVFSIPFAGILNAPEWQRQALALLPRLRRDVSDWASLDGGRRDATVLALFAVATILDDIRVVQWAIREVDALAAEFGFVAANALPRAPDGADEEPAIETWKRTCAAVVEVAHALATDAPDLSQLHHLRVHFKRLEKLSDGVAADLAAARRNRSAATVADLVENLAREHDAPWLVELVEQIQAQWKLVYIDADSPTSDELFSDVARAQRDLPAAVAEWRRCQNERDSLDTKVRAIHERPKPDLASQLRATDEEATLHEAIADITKRVLAAFRRALTAAAPKGLEFDHATDYIGELRAVSEAKDGVPKRTITEPVAHEVPGVDADAKEVEGSTSDAATRPDSQGEPGLSGNVEAMGEPGLSGNVEATGGSGARQTRTSEGPRTGEVGPGLEGGERPRELGGKAVTWSGSAEMPSADGSGETVAVDAPLLERAGDALWRSMSSRPGISYHIARLLDEQSLEDPRLPSAELIGAALLARHVESPDSSVVGKLGEFLACIAGEDLSGVDQQHRDSLNVMLFTATLAPALLAPSTGAGSLLRRVATSSRLQPVGRLANVVAEHAQRLRGGRLDLALMRASLSRQVWEEKFSKFTARVAGWSAKAERQHVLFSGAQRVWKRWLRKDGYLGQLTDLLLTSKADRKQQVEQFLHRLSDQREFSLLVRETDQGRSSGKAPDIIGRALTQLHAHAQVACDLAAEWLRIMDVQPSSTGFVEKRVSEFRGELVKYGHAALRALAEVPPGEVTMGAVGPQAREAIERLLTVLDGDGMGEGEGADGGTTSSARVLGRDLLYVTELDVDGEFGVLATEDKVRSLELLVDTAGHASTMSEACRGRIDRGNLAGAGLGCEVLRRSGDGDFDECSAALERAVRAFRKEVREELARAKEEVEQAFSGGQLSDQERDVVGKRIASAEFALRESHRVEVVQAEVAGVRRWIEGSGARLVREVWARFRGMAGGLEEEERTAIAQCIEAGDVVAANELISHLGQGGSIDSPRLQSRDALREFVAVADGTRGEDLSGLTPNAVIEAAGRRRRVAGIDFGRLSGQQAKEAAALLKTWYRLSVLRRDGLEALEDLLAVLGFEVREQKSVEAGRDWVEMAVTTDTIRDRSVCPVPRFGSDANGRYRILLNWSQSASVTVSRTIGSGVGQPLIMLHFGHLGAERESLRRWGIAKQRPFLVVDESLVWYLSLRQSGERLAALFACALPFAAVDCYVTTSSLVPPELFYGREREQQSAVDRYGTCFFFGGRQLGKTALLRTVERTFHDPSRRRLAKWLDLKGADIGYGRPAEDFWELLRRALQELGPVARKSRPLASGNAARVDGLVGDIEQWIGQDEEGRILVLLDEADGFLEVDALSDFRVATRLKDLMDRTDRRFKVVLAGLHNVLRTMKLVNHPLAHFGQPVSVGPLAWEEAQRLVRDPLCAAGCRFEFGTLTSRILAHTNYYPALIQLYGDEFVRQLRDSTKPFPYSVASTDVDEVYRNSGLRSAIRQRFLWTLHLDQRYEVLAYALAHMLLTQGADIEQGVGRRQLCAAARAWWKDGFERTEDRDFEVLLDEMAGLGVVRALNDGRLYTLRNPNILLLLGSMDDVEGELAKEREPQEGFDAASVHPRYSGSRSSAKYSPLTHQQMSDVTRGGGVTVICGSVNAHVGYIREHLATQAGWLRVLPVSENIGAFEDAIGGLRPRTGETGGVALVAESAPWNLEWVVAARKAMRKKKWNIRIVFVADELWTWRMMEGERWLEDGGADWCVVRPWGDRFLRRWLDDNGLPSDREHRTALLAVTGGWPLVLERFLRRRRNRDWETRLEEMRLELRREGERKRLLKGFGISEESVAREMRGLCGLVSAYGDETVEEIGREVGLSADGVRRRFRWSELLGLCEKVGGEWAFNPLIEGLLAADSG